MNPLLRLKELGQSVWLDYIDRRLLASGELERLIREDGLSGVTSNPTIFQKAISEVHEYDTPIAELQAGQAGKSSKELFYVLAQEDIGQAADLLRACHEASGRRDGFVSLEVAPDLAYQTEATIEEARMLFSRLGRPNVMIKVPATRQGLAAIERLTAEGVNVNVTLLFSVQRYREVADAYLSGLEARRKRGLPVDTIASVASFFVSRIDTKVDALLEQQARQAPQRRAALLALRGKTAIANAKIAYQAYQEICGGARFAELARAGAGSQRLLWGSTGTKNPDYSDVLYVDTLIGPDTVNTLPPATLAAYRDHGAPETTLTRGIEDARAALNAVRDAGIDLEQVTDELEAEGVEKFAESYHSLLRSLDERAAELKSARAGRAR